MTSPCHRSLGSREQGVPETKGNEHSDMVVTRQGAVATHLEAKEGSTRSADPSFFCFGRERARRPRQRDRFFGTIDIDDPDDLWCNYTAHLLRPLKNKHFCYHHDNNREITAK
jgi:hypothetical protein